jgi:hypothetical protein
MWGVLAWLGALLILVGGLDVVMVWVPAQWVSASWGFSAAGGFLDTIPLLGLGLALTLAASVALGRRWTTRVTAALCVVLALAVALAAMLLAKSLPESLEVATDPLIRTQITKLAVKAGLQGLVYLVSFVGLAVLAWRATSTPVRR